MSIKNLKCTLPDCDRHQVARGFCNLHYRRLMRRGSTDERAVKSWFDRAMAKTEVIGDCWIFNGGNSRGYGQIKVDGKQFVLPRYAFEQLVEPLKPGNMVCHKCDTPQCWNPGHLFQGTHDDNMRDMADKGRSNKIFGEARHTSKLTDADVRRVRSLLSTGTPQRTIAKELNISQASVWAINTKRRWNHVS